MEVIDLTHTILPEMPVFPGDPAPRVEPVATVARDGFATSLFSIGSHSGTHMDAPAHVRADAPTLDLLSADSFVGPAFVVDCRDVPAGGTADMSLIGRFGPAALEAARKAEFLLFDFGWDARWGTPQYFTDYPCIGLDVVRFAVETGKKAVGFDTPNVDPLDDAALTRHGMLLTEGVMVIENLKCLDRLHAEGPDLPAGSDMGLAGWGTCLFAALPLKVRDCDGSPVRAIAILGD